MNKTPRLWLAFVAVLSLASCQQDIVFQDKKPVAGPYWRYEDAISFDFPVQDTTLLYDLYLHVHHSPTYLFQNLYTYITTTYPSGKTRQQQLNIDLADKLGKWYAKCGGSNCHLKVVLQANAYFEEVGKHQITLVQHTRQDSLAGISNIGFELKQVGFKREKQ